MLNSRDLSLLRDDVEVNCRKWLARCKAAGLNVLVTNTVRDAEYQAYLYEQGRTRSGSIVTNLKTPTFHADTAGLAFDFCKNIKGHEYDDTAFFREAAAIAKEMGFSWGGDWKSFVDRPHIQWDNGGTWTSAMILAGKLPPQMPAWQEPTTEDTQPKEWEENEKREESREESEENEMRYNSVADCPAWAQDTIRKLVDRGALTGDGSGLNLSDDMVRLLVICERTGAFEGK